MEVTLFGVRFSQLFIGGTVCSLIGKQRSLQVCIQGTCSGHKVLVQPTSRTDELILGQTCSWSSTLPLDEPYGRVRSWSIL